MYVCRTLWGEPEQVKGVCVCVCVCVCVYVRDYPSIELSRLGHGDNVSNFTDNYGFQGMRTGGVYCNFINEYH